MSGYPIIALLTSRLWTSSKWALVRRTARSNSGATAWTVVEIISGKTFANFPPRLYPGKLTDLWCRLKLSGVRFPFMSTGSENCIGQIKTPLSPPDGEHIFSTVLLGSATYKICMLHIYPISSADAINMQPIKHMLPLNGNMLDCYCNSEFPASYF